MASEQSTIPTLRDAGTSDGLENRPNADVSANIVRPVVEGGDLGQGNIGPTVNGAGPETLHVSPSQSTSDTSKGSELESVSSDSAAHSGSGSKQPHLQLPHDSRVRPTEHRLSNAPVRSSPLVPKSNVAVSNRKAKRETPQFGQEKFHEGEDDSHTSDEQQSPRGSAEGLKDQTGEGEGEDEEPATFEGLERPSLVSTPVLVAKGSESNLRVKAVNPNTHRNTLSACINYYESDVSMIPLEDTRTDNDLEGVELGPGGSRPASMRAASSSVPQVIRPSISSDVSRLNFLRVEDEHNARTGPAAVQAAANSSHCNLLITANDDHRSHTSLPSTDLGLGLGLAHHTPSLPSRLGPTVGGGVAAEGLSARWSHCNLYLDEGGRASPRLSTLSGDLEPPSSIEGLSDDAILSAFSSEKPPQSPTTAAAAAAAQAPDIRVNSPESGSLGVSAAGVETKSPPPPSVPEGPPSPWPESVSRVSTGRGDGEARRYLVLCRAQGAGEPGKYPGRGDRGGTIVLPVYDAEDTLDGARLDCIYATSGHNDVLRNETTRLGIDQRSYSLADTGTLPHMAVGQDHSVVLLRPATCPSPYSDQGIEPQPARMTALSPLAPHNIVEGAQIGTDKNTNSTVLVVGGRGFDMGRLVHAKRCSALLTHTNLGRVMDPWVDGAGGFYAVMEPMAGGHLGTLKADMKGQCLPGDLVARLSQQLLGAVDYLHGLAMAHANIRPENCWLDANHKTLKLAGFEYTLLLPLYPSTHTGPGAMPVLPRPTRYTAPELHDPTRQLTTISEKRGTFFKLCDSYSVGVTLLELAAERPPDGVGVEEGVERWVQAHQGGKENGAGEGVWPQLGEMHPDMVIMVGGLVARDVGQRWAVRRAVGVMKKVVPVQRVRPVYAHATVLLG